MTRTPRKPSTPTMRGVLRPFALVGAAIVATLLLIGLAFGVLPGLQESPLRSPVVRVIVENRTERPMQRVRIERSDDGTVLTSSPRVPYGQHMVMERPQGEDAEWRLSFDQDGERHTFHGFDLRATYAELQVITVTPGPCIDGQRGDVSDAR